MFVEFQLEKKLSGEGKYDKAVVYTIMQGVGKVETTFPPSPIMLEFGAGSVLHEQ